MLLLFSLLGDATQASIQAAPLRIPQYALRPGAYHWNNQLAVKSGVSKPNIHTFVVSFLHHCIIAYLFTPLTIETLIIVESLDAEVFESSQDGK